MAPDSAGCSTRGRADSTAPGSIPGNSCARVIFDMGICQSAACGYILLRLLLPHRIEVGVGIENRAHGFAAARHHKTQNNHAYCFHLHSSLY
jgi:hypothetical protein